MRPPRLVVWAVVAAHQLGVGAQNECAAADALQSATATAQQLYEHRARAYPFIFSLEA